MVNVGTYIPYNPYMDGTGWGFHVTPRGQLDSPMPTPVGMPIEKTHGQKDWVVMHHQKTPWEAFSGSLRLDFYFFLKTVLLT